MKTIRSDPDARATAIPARALLGALAGIVVTSLVGCSMPFFSGPEPGTLERVWKERVSTFTFRAEEMEHSDISRLAALLTLLPEGIKRAPSTQYRTVYGGDAVTHLTFDLADRGVHAWIYASPRRDSELNIMYTNPRRDSEPYMYEHGRCDRELVYKAPAASLDPLIRASIQYRRLPGEPWILGLQLVMCDVPYKRDRAEALEFFLDSVLTPVEKVLLSGQASPKKP